MGRGGSEQEAPGDQTPQQLLCTCSGQPEGARRPIVDWPLGVRPGSATEAGWNPGLRLFLSWASTRPTW